MSEHTANIDLANTAAATRTGRTWAAPSNTTRRHPRTAAEAFKGADYGQAWHPHIRSRWSLTGYEWGAVFALACLVAGLVLAAL